MRILALSEIPELWAEHVAEWRRLNAGFVRSANGRRSPSAGPRIHALSGADRRVAARRRSTRISSSGSRTTPSKRRGRASSRRAGSIRTSDYEQGLRGFRPRDPRPRPVRGVSRIRLRALARRTALLGALNSLTQLVLKATMPGVPDFYQGTETWDLSLVDPDNRRPVDFAARQAVLAASAEADWLELASHWTDGRIKLALTHRLLSLAKRAAGAVSRWRIRAGRGDRAAIAITSWRSAVRRDAIAWWSRSRGTSPAGPIVAHRWPDRGWQAELKLDQRHRRACAMRLAAGGNCRVWKFQDCSPRCRSRCCGIERRFHLEPCAALGPFRQRRRSMKRQERRPHRAQGARVRRHHISAGGRAVRNRSRRSRVRHIQLIERCRRDHSDKDGNSSAAKSRASRKAIQPERRHHWRKMNSSPVRVEPIAIPPV